MRKVYVLLFGLLILCSCDKFKGDKGDAGSDSGGIVFSRTYTGYPQSNPYNVGVTSSINLSTDSIEVFKVNAQDVLFALPVTVGDYIDLYTVANNGGAIGINTISAGGNPTYALQDIVGNRYKFYIVHKRFKNAAACIAYRNSKKPDASGVNGLIYGRDM